MQTVPQIEPITSFVRNHKATLAKLAHGPVILSQRGHSAAVLTSIERWDEICDYIAKLEQDRRSMVAAQKLEALRNSDQPTYTFEELEAVLDADSA